MEPHDVYLCHKCGKIFYKLSTLESHSRWKHAEKTNEFMCDQCGRTFQKKYNLIKHLESAVHEISESVNCALCDFKSLNRKLMCEHYQSFHGIVLKETNVYFKTAEEFFVWKSEFEHKTKSRFVKMSSSRMRKNGFIRSTYFCHRDGNFIPKGRNLRHMKVKGSNKINAHCPAKIEVEIGERITIVSYIDTHLGHDQDISRMSIDPADKVLIARKLALKVPFEQILDEVNSYRKGGEMKRVHMLTRKDLWNIVDTFKINPKNVVFSKNRIRRKKRFEDLRRDPRRNAVCLKIFNQDPNSVEEEEVVYDTNEEEQYTGRQIISLKQESDGNVIFCPVSDENDPYVEEYSVVAEGGDEEGGTCLIINANGELQSITGHKIIYTEEGNVEICEALEMDDSEMIVDDQSLPSQIENSDIESSMVSNEDKGVVLENEPDTFNSQEYEIKTSQSENEYISNAAENDSDTVIVKEGDDSCVKPERDEEFISNTDENDTGHVIIHEADDSRCMKPESEEEISAEPEIVFIKTETNEDPTNQAVLALKDDITEYEVTISNYDEGEEGEYVIISTENEDMVECGIDPNEHPTEELDRSAILETVVLDTEENDPECSVVTGEVIYNTDGCEEYVASNEGDEPKWNVKRQETLHKLINVQNLISSDQQVLSNNISSLENVLKALSKNSNQDSE